LQFQLTVNIVALLLVFIGAVAGFGEPLNAVQMLWVNLVMDTLGALALATEPPSMELLNRKPYKRSVALLSKPLWRNIFIGSIYQIIMLLVLLFDGPALFNVYPSDTGCLKFTVKTDSGRKWDPHTHKKFQNIKWANMSYIECSTFEEHDYCGTSKDSNCLYDKHQMMNGSSFKFGELDSFEESCLTCALVDYTHGTIIFNAFIFCQFFNLFNSRILFSDRLNPFYNLRDSSTFAMVALFIFGCQVFLINIAGEFMKVTPLNLTNWLITIGLGVIVIPLGVFSRFVPIVESPEDFFDNTIPTNEIKVSDEKQIL